MIWITIIGLAIWAEIEFRIIGGLLFPGRPPIPLDPEFGKAIEMSLSLIRQPIVLKAPVAADVNRRHITLHMDPPGNDPEQEIMEEFDIDPVIESQRVFSRDVPRGTVITLTQQDFDSSGNAGEIKTSQYTVVDTVGPPAPDDPEFGTATEV